MSFKLIVIDPAFKLIGPADGYASSALSCWVTANECCPHAPEEYIQRCCRGVQHMPEEYSTVAKEYIQHCFKRVQHMLQRSTTLLQKSTSLPQRSTTLLHTQAGSPPKYCAGVKHCWPGCSSSTKHIWSYLIQCLNCMKAITACHPLLLFPNC